MSDLPAPLTPPECDLRGLEYMPLLGQHLFGSEFNARANDSEWRAALTLWWAAWTQMPAASLPNDDGALCRLADLGRDLKSWRKVKAIALYGFVECSDGRLYHPVIAKQALLAWDKRVKERDRKAAWRAKKAETEQGQGADVPRDKPVKSHGTEAGQDADVPADVTRRDGTGRDVKKEEEGSVADATERHALVSASPIELQAAIFKAGVALLTEAGSTDAAARSILGKWRKHHGDGAVLDALAATVAESASDPIPFITRVLEHRNGNRPANHNDPRRDSYGREEPIFAARRRLGLEG